MLYVERPGEGTLSVTDNTQCCGHITHLAVTASVKGRPLLRLMRKPDEGVTPMNLGDTAHSAAVGALTLSVVEV